ncbi:hypothetical protein GCM10010308_63680 [Streptomyces vinaceusdrappus]|nr:hypothetical protein GCM10010308_63680 [Streptomyces vinaceusdrappus]
MEATVYHRTWTAQFPVQLPTVPSGVGQTMKKLITLTMFAIASLVGTIAPAQAADTPPPAFAPAQSDLSAPNSPLADLHPATI